MDLLQAPLAIVDLETTGTRPASDRVTEIGVLEIERFEVVSEWSTLVNPGVPVPSEIQALTGINHEMLAQAPRFADLAQELHERLAGRVFIAHNARFDYGFLRREFDRAGIKFHARAVCSVKLARRLYPRERGHDLDSLIARHGIVCQARHRAMGDADALWQFLRIAAEEHGEEVLTVAARQVAKEPALPPQLDRAAIDAIPEAPGVYLLYGESGPPLYIGKSRSMRSRVLQHFYSSAAWLQAVRRIDWQRTVGELGALLTEARLVKQLAPLHNRQLRRPERLCGFVFDGKRLRLVSARPRPRSTPTRCPSSTASSARGAPHYKPCARWPTSIGSASKCWASMPSVKAPASATRSAAASACAPAARASMRIMAGSPPRSPL